MQRPDVGQAGEVAGQGSDAVARFRGGSLDPGTVRTDQKDSMAGFAQRSCGGDPGRTAAAGDHHVQGVSATHPAFRARVSPAAPLPVSDDPVMPAVDSMTGRIFFSSAS
ncbi:hypothetical protein D9M72_552480 [compost metagenome]